MLRIKSKNEKTIKIETTRYSRLKVKKQIDLDSLDMGDDE